MATTTTTTEWAIGKWANRASLTYTPICNAINGEYVSAFGVLSRGYIDFYVSSQKRPYKQEVNDTTGIAYVMYGDDTDKDVPIIRITEA